MVSLPVEVAEVVEEYVEGACDAPVRATLLRPELELRSMEASMSSMSWREEREERR